VRQIARFIVLGTCGTLKATAVITACTEFQDIPAEGLCSRLFVGIPVLLLASAGRLPLSKMRCFCSFQAPNGAKLRVKCTQFAAFKKVMSFVFRQFLRFVPTIFHFFKYLASRPRRDPTALYLAEEERGGDLLQNIPNENTVIGYHKSTGLSSGICRDRPSRIPLP